MLFRIEQESASLNLRAGELVEVRSKEEILATLDQSGILNSLPFMPEMLKFCGKRFRVHKSAHKTCDTINKTGGRRMENAVHLEDLRCDGEAHAGCQAGCLLFWHEAWLKRVDEKRQESGSSLSSEGRRANVCSEDALRKSVVVDAREKASTDSEPTYRCQTTELLKFTSPLKWWDIRQYIRDVISGNVTIPEVVRAGVFRVFVKIVHYGGYNLLTSAYDRMQTNRGGIPFPFRQGKLQSATPPLQIGLQAGDTVQVKSQNEILETLNKQNKNRGLSFDPEMVKYCGQTRKVLRRVEVIINEQTGKLMKLPNDAVILDGVTCGAHFSSKRLFCPRAVYPFWREAWLKRLK